MIKELKNNFMQVAFVTTVLIVLLSTIFIPNKSIALVDLWSIIKISILFAFTFGIVIPYLWNYSTFKALSNVVISTVVNTFCGLVGIYIFSLEMFRIVWPYTSIIVFLTLTGNIIGFFFYSRYENRKLAKEINNLLQ